jgi:uncharacterized protein with NAD-binding domain and iron-sulfur cluster
MVGVLNGDSQWIFDRAFAKQAKILSVVITGQIQDRIDTSMTGNSSMTSNSIENNLVKKVSKEVAKIFPHLPSPLQSKVVTEKRAAFSCIVNINAKRPNNATPIPNLFLAGDYINTGYPATLEGAVMSGFAVSALICFNLDRIADD